MSFDPNARVSGDGIVFHMHFPDTTGTACVTGQALREFFGADVDPGTWLDAYRANFRAIHAVAQQKEYATTERPVMVTPTDLHAVDRP
jgi:hypothetical protein